jgi:hypothetical protein
MRCKVSLEYSRETLNLDAACAWGWCCKSQTDNPDDVQSGNWRTFYAPMHVLSSSTSTKIPQVIIAIYRDLAMVSLRVYLPFTMIQPFWI